MKTLRMSFLLVLVLLLASCAGQIDYPVGLSLYKAGQDTPEATLTQAQKDAQPLEVESDREGFGKIVIFAESGEGTEWYYRKADLPATTEVAPEGATTEGEGKENAKPVLPESLQETLGWFETYILGLWQLWVGTALSVLTGWYVYRWLLVKKTPKPFDLGMDDIATAIPVYTFGLQMEGSYILSAEPDRANAFQELEGKTTDEKIEKARQLILTHLEGDVTLRASQTSPENINREIGRWVTQMNKSLANANWRNPRGMLENFPVTGLELRNIRLVGFIPGEDMRNYLATPSETERHGQALTKLKELNPHLSTKEVAQLYVELDRSNALRDAASSLGGALGKALVAFTGGEK